MAKNVNPQHSEGQVASFIEEQTAKLPSDVFLWTALGFMTISITLYSIGRRHEGLLVGQWTAPFLIMGLYNKLVKLEGHD